MTVDMLRLLSRTALDLVGSSAIGYNFDTLNTDSEYSDAVKRVLFVFLPIFTLVDEIFTSLSALQCAS